MENDENSMVTTEDEQEQGASFGRGIALGAGIGALSTALIILLVMIGIRFYKLSQISSTSTSNTGTTNTTTTDTSTSTIPLTLGDSVASKMNTIQSIIDKYFLYDYDKDEMADAIYDAMMASLDDPYSVYYTAEEYQDMISSTEGTYCGLGVVVTQDTETKQVLVLYPYEDSPGEKAGLLPNDIILAADGTELTGMDLDQAVTLIKGEEGTDVTLTIQRGEDVFDVVATRAKIDIVTVGSKMLDNDIGYIQVTQFDGVTTEQFKSAIDDLISQGMKGLIIDIRSNPGGRLDVVTDMLDYILPEGLTVYTEDKNGNRSEYSSDAATVLTVPCAVLVNGESASASEIFSGALQDYDVAEIIGTQTFGKGIVQTILQLTDGSAVKITIEDYYTPNGHNIHHVGITPDEVVELDTDAYTADGTDTQLNAAVDYIMEQIQ